LGACEILEQIIPALICHKKIFKKKRFSPTKFNCNTNICINRRPLPTRVVRGVSKNFVKIIKSVTESRNPICKISEILVLVHLNCQSHGDVTK
jgi:hypothetical protein